MIINNTIYKDFILHAYSMYLKEKEDKTVNWFQNDIVDGFTTIVDEVLYIVFRGTDDEKVEQQNNYRYTKTRVPYNGTSEKIQVHTGFIDIYDTEEVRAELHKRVKAYINASPDPRIHITGHSQGAAEAILCAVDLEYNFGAQINELINIPMAPPRVGNKAFAKSYDRRVPNTYCMWYGWDIVPKIPLWTMGFRHVGKRIIMAPRNIFQVTGNIIKGLFTMLVKKRSGIYDKFDREPTRGSDLCFFDDHSPHHYPVFSFNTEFLKIKNKISLKEIKKGIV